MADVERSSYEADEADYLRLGNRWREVHDADWLSPWMKYAISGVTLLALAPVIGMVLVFAVLPMLPIALLCGAVLGPMNLFKNGEVEEEEVVYRHRLEFAAAHGMLR